MTDLHPVDRVPRSGSRRLAPDVKLAEDAIRRGVQYLAFRLLPQGLAVRYEPGPGYVSGLVARAARAAARAHDDLAAARAADRPSSARQKAVAARVRFARQLAEVRDGATPRPRTALRLAYLEALADHMIEVLRREGLEVLDAWTAASGADREQVPPAAGITGPRGAGPGFSRTGP